MTLIRCVQIIKYFFDKSTTISRVHKTIIFLFFTLSHRYIAYCLPQTFACEAMRGILLRGWDLTYMPVYRGFLVSMT